MSQFIRDFVEHPRSVGESYLQHMGSALGFSWLLFAAAFCCAAHALLPGLFKCSASAQIVLLHDRMVTNRHRHEIAANADVTDSNRPDLASTSASGGS